MYSHVGGSLARRKKFLAMKYVCVSMSMQSKRNTLYKASMKKIRKEETRIRGEKAASVSASCTYRISHRRWKILLVYSGINGSVNLQGA